MITIIWIYAIVSMLFIGCSKPSDLANTLTAEDELALEEMGHAFEGAKAYQDSLVLCIDSVQTCTDSVITHYDNEFHAHVQEWEEFHGEYSHNNVDDDHHHSVDVEHHHGNMGHVDEGHTDGEEDHGHSIESHQDMDQLLADHEPYHPN